MPMNLPAIRYTFPPGNVHGPMRNPTASPQMVVFDDLFHSMSFYWSSSNCEIELQDALDQARILDADVMISREVAQNLLDMISDLAQRKQPVREAVEDVAEPLRDLIKAKTAIPFWHTLQEPKRKP